MLIGVVGKANVGKSTFFKSATLAEVEIANYPFTTIKPNEGMGFVRVDCVEKFFRVKCQPRQGFCIDGQRFVPFKLIDVAGLVPGAHEGRGLGNKFLNDLSQADVLIHIVDASGSTDAEGKVIEAGTYEPCNDVKFLEDELDFWFAEMLKENWQKFVRQSFSTPADKALAKQFSGLKVSLDMVVSALRKLDLTNKKLADWTDRNVFNFASELRKKSKPIIIAANKIDLPTAKENVEKLKKTFPDYLIVPCSAESELALREAAKSGLIKYIPGDNHFEILKPEKLSEKQRKALEFVDSRILKIWRGTGIQRCLNTSVFDYLRYKIAYPVENASKACDNKGDILPDAFLLEPNATALELAYHVHTSIGEKFIRGINAKTRQIIGKDYPLKDGDVIEIVAGK